MKTYNLPRINTALSEIDAKPMGLFILLIILSVVSFILKFPIVYGATLIIISIVCICFFPRVTLMEFYDDYFVMFNRVDKNSCVLIYYDEVVSWKYVWTAKKDILSIELVDGSQEKIEAFSKTIFEAYMNRYLHGKKKEK